MSHSKFPWSTHPQVPTGVYDADGMKVAVAVSMTAEEDAALIAAIPAMVEALQAAKEHFDDEFSESSDLPHKHRILKMCDKIDSVLASIGKKGAPAK